VTRALYVMDRVPVVLYLVQGRHRWVLPFRDRADYIPECNSWLGFTSRDGLLCSLDLSTTASGRTKPVVSSVLEEGTCKSVEDAP
jgi:hypothetical protein